MSSQKKSSKQTVILYHADCADGFGAAWAAWKKYKDSATYIAVPPNNREVPSAAKGKDVFTLDYAFPLDAMKEVRSQIRSLMVIDHHETNKEAWLVYPKGIPMSPFLTYYSNMIFRGPEELFKFLSSNGKKARRLPKLKKSAKKRRVVFKKRK